MDSSRPVRRRGKEIRERFLSAALLIPAAPVIAVAAVAIKLEGLVDRDARGPVFFSEQRVSRGRVIQLLKFRTLTKSALDSLGPGPTHIGVLERQRRLTRIGRFLKAWYLDELPQLWNIVRGDMFLIGTRPYPLDLYEQELARGITRKRDMPAGLIGPVQANKGTKGADGVDLDAQYWDMFRSASAWQMFRVDSRIVMRSLGVQLRHEGL
ncbi:MAG: sugar transferase [Actinomycetota bacterium]|nr:sugar transferase [Actinomycetota bacterium]